MLTSNLKSIITLHIMKLKQYLDIKNLTQREFAERLGAHYMTVYKICAGRRRPSPEMAHRIEKETGGQVSRLESLYPE